MDPAPAKPPHRRWLKALLASTSLSAAGSLLVAVPSALANPQGGQVVGGAGTIVQSPSTPNRLVINQTTENLALDWQSFNIAAGEQVIFQQPNAAAIALNRVTGGDPSTIAGQLTANGQVWLVNPNGVFFTRGAVVNVAGIVATTSSIDPASFMAGNYVFDQPGAANASVINAGRVTVADAGLAAFVAPTVANSGVIAARLGKVALVSGSKFTVDLYGDNLVKIAVDDQTGSALAGAAVSNSGKIAAAGGTVLLSVSAAESIVNNAINVSGTIEARTAGMKDGKIVLSGAAGQVAVSGTLDASGKSAGETGGTVEVLGGAVALGPTARVDVSGDAGGGTALIGGNFHGAGPEPDAATTSLAAGAIITADAITSGNGGAVALWSNEATDDAGSITARGGALSGNGGFVETSSGNRLTIADGAIVNTGAANGKGGEWLLDPTEIDITTADNNDTTQSPFTTIPMTTGSTVANTTIDAALGTGDVVIQTAAGDIALDADIVPDNTAGGNHSLGLASAGSILLNANINFATATGSASTGSVYLFAPAGSITQSAGTITLAGGQLSMQAGTGIGIGGAISVAGADASTIIGVAAATSSGGIAVTGGTGILEVASVPGATLSGVSFGPTTGMAGGGTLTLAGGSIVVAAPLSATAISLTGTSGVTFDDAAGTLATSAGGGQVYNGAITLAADATLIDTAAGPITFVNTIDATTAGAQALTITASNSIALGGTVGGTTPLGAITLSDTELELAANIAITTSGGAVSQTGATVLLGGTSGSTVAIDTTANTTAPGANISFSGALDGTAAGYENLSLAAGSGAITLSGDLGSGTALGALTLTDAALDLGAGLSIVTSGGAVSQTGAAVLLGGASPSIALIDTTANGASSGADIGFSSTIDGTSAGQQGLSLHAGANGTIALSDAVGSSTALGAVTLASGGTIAIAHSLTTSGGAIAATSASDITVTAPIESGSGAITLAAADGLTISASVGSSQAGPVSLSAAQISLGAAIDGGAALTIGPSTGSANIGLGSGSNATSDEFHLSQAELDEIGPDFTAVSIATGSGTLHVDNGGTALAFANPVTLAGGAIALLDGGGLSTSGKALTLAAPVTLGNNATLDTTASGHAAGANITLADAVTGSSAGAQSLTIDAGTSGTIALDGAVGAPTPLGSVTLSDAVLDLAANVGITTANGAVSETGQTMLLGTTSNSASTIATSDGDIFFSGSIDGDQAGKRSLTLAAGTGTITLQANVGASQPLDNLTLSDGQLDLAGTIGIATADGAVSQSGITLLSGGASPSSVTIATTGGMIAFAETIDGDVSGKRSLVLEAGTGTVSLAMNVGSTTPLGAVTLSDAALDLAANAGIKTSDGAVSETGATVLGGAGATTTTISTSGGNIAFGAIDGSVSGDQALLLSAGAGTVTLSGAIGAHTPLGAVTLSDEQLVLMGSLSLAAASFSQSDTTLLEGGSASAVTIATSGGAIGFASTIDADTAGLRALTLSAGTGTITLQGSIGGATPLGAVSLTDAALDLAANVGIRTADGAVSESGATILGGAGATTTTIATSGGAIAFGAIDGSVSGDQALLLNAGTGTITLSGAIGAQTPLGGLTLSDGQLALMGGLSLAATAFSQSGATLLEGGSASAVTIATAGGAIGFDGTIDADSAGLRALTLSAGTGTITLQGSVGGATALGAVSLSDAALDLAANVGIRTADGAVSQSGRTVLGGAGATSSTIATSGGNIAFGAIDGTISGRQALDLDAGSGTISLAASIGAMTPLGAVTLNDALLDLAANVGIVSANGAISQTGAALIEGGASATLTTIDTTDAGGFAGANIIWGASDGTAPGHPALSFAAGSGTITLQGNLGGQTALGAVTLSGAATDLAANAGIATSDGAVTVTGALVLQGATPSASSIATAGGTITLNRIDGGTAGEQALTLDAGATGTILLQANVGATTALGALTFTDALLELGAGVSVATSGGAIAQSGTTLLLAGTGASATLIDTTAAGHAAGANIGFAEALDAGAAGSESLTLDAGTGGTISLSGPIGGTTPLGAVTLSDAVLDIAANVGVTTAGGSFSQTGATLFLGGAATASTIATAGGNIAFAGTVDGGSRGDQALTLNAGTGTVTFSGNAGNNTALGALSLTDAALDLGANVSLVTSGGAVGNTGALVLLGGASAGIAAIDTTAGGLSAGADITLAQHVDATGSGKQGLSLTAGTGTITLQADVGGTTPLGAVTLRDAELDLAANVGIATANGAVSEVGTTILGGGSATAATIATAGGTIAFGTIDGSVSGAQALRLNAGTGTIALNGSLGATTPLGAITLTDAALDIAANVSVTIAGDAFSQTGSTVFLGAVPTSSTIATNGGAIAFAGTIDGTSPGDQALNFTAGTGTVTLSGNAGRTTPLGALSFTAAALDLGVGVSVVTSNGAVTNTGALVLLGGASAGTAAIDTTAGGLSLGAGITLAQAIDATGAGNQALALASGTGTITVQANIGATTPLGALSLSDAVLLLPANFTATTAGGAISQTGATLLSGAGATITTFDTTDAGHAAAGANIALAGPVDGSVAGAQALVLSAGSGGTITLSGNLGGTTPLGAVTLSDAVLDIAAHVATFGAPVSQAGATIVTAPVTIDTTAGGTAAGANISFAAIDGGGVNPPVTLTAGTGTIALMGKVGANTALGSLILSDAELEIGPNVTIDAMVSSGESVIAQSGPTVLLGGAQATSSTITASSVTFDGPIDGTAPGQQALTIAGDTVLLDQSLGTQTPLGAVTLHGLVLDLAANVSIITSGGAVQQTGETVLLGDGMTPTSTVIDTNAGDTTTLVASITFVGDIQGSAPGLQSLTLSAGNVSLSNVGTSTALGALTFNDSILSIAPNVSIMTSGGAITQTGQTVLLGTSLNESSPTSVFIGTGSLAAPTGANITFAAQIDGSFAGTGPLAGAQALTLDAGSGGTISLSGNVGGGTALGALTLRDAVLDLAPNMSIATAGGAFQQSGTTVLSGATAIATTASSSGGANIIFAGSIDGGALVLDAGAGTISLQGDIGAATPLGAVTLVDSQLLLAPNVGIVTSGGAVSETGDIVLLAGAGPTLSVIDTTAGATVAGADITVAGKIDGGAAGQQALTLDAGGATIALSGNVGRTTALGALTLSDALLQIGPDTSIATAGGAILQPGAVVLLGGAGATATTIDTTGGGLVAGGADMMFGGTIDGSAAGQQGLTLTAGTAGTITLQQNLGAATPLGALTMSDALLQLPAGFSATTARGAVSQSGAVLLAGATLIDTTNAGNSASGANITLAGTVDGSSAGAQALTLDAGLGGTIALTGNLGGSTALGAVSLSDAVLDLGANITTAAGAVSQTGATVVGSAAIDTTEGGATAGGANITMAGSIDGTGVLGLLTLDAGSGTIALSGNVGRTTLLGWLTLVDGELDLAPNVGITTVLNFSQTGATILLGGATATVNSVTGGSCSNAPGMACFVGTITFDGPVDGSASGKQALTLSSDGTIGLQGGVGAQTPLGAVTLNGAALELAPNVAIVTAGGAVSQTGLAELLGNGAAPTATTIDTTAGGTVAAGANITFAGDIDGSTPGLQALSLDAGASGTIALAAVGNTTALGALSLSDATLRLGANATIATAGGAFAQLGTTLIATGTGATVAAIDSTAGGLVPTGASITFGGPIDGASAGENALTLDAGSGGTISLLGAVGSGTPLGAVTLNDDALALGGGASITTAAGAFSETGATLLLAGTGPSIAVIDTIAGGRPQGANIVFDGPIDGAAAGLQALTLDSGTQGTISLLGSVGGATALGALSFTDAVLALGPNVTVVTAGDAVSETGAMILLAGTSASASAIDTTDRGAAPLGADLTFSGAIDGTGAGGQSLALDAGTAGTIALAANIGTHTALGGLSLIDGLLQLPASLAITSAGGAVSETGSTIIAGGTAPSSLVIDTTAGGTISAGGDITLGTLNGAAAGRLALTLNAGSGGTIALMGGVGSEAALATLSLTDAALALGPGAGVTTAGTPFVETGATLLLGNGAAATANVIDTTNDGASPAGANIVFAGPIDGGVAGKQSLTLAAGAATIALGGSIGSATALGALTFDDSILALGPNIGISTAGGAVLQTGVTRLLAGAPVAMGPSSRVTIATTAAGAATGADISFGDTIDGSTVGGEALALSAGSAGTITLAANVGAATPLGGLALGGGTIDLDGILYQTNAGAITATGVANFLQPHVTVATVMQATGSTPPAATTGAAITFAAVSGPTTTLTVDPGTAFASIGGGTLGEIAVIEGSGSTLNGLVVGETSLGGTGTGNGLTVAGFGGSNAALHAFIRPGGNWLINGGAVLITDPALAGLSNAVLNNEGIGPAIALMVQIQQLIARGDTGETAAQQAFDQYPNRSNYAADPFHQRYNILGVAQQEGVGGFEDISYIQDGFWEGLLKAK